MNCLANNLASSVTIHQILLGYHFKKMIKFNSILQNWLLIVYDEIFYALMRYFNVIVIFSWGWGVWLGII